MAEAQQSDMDGSMSESTVAATVLFTFLSTAFVLIRVYSRRFLQKKWRSDDYAVVSAWVSFLHENTTCLPFSHADIELD